jgi:peptidoglycan/LPS O-acetylase OafA/YrhL
LLLIGHSILFFNDEMFHPSFYTLSPIIGVCLIIWFSNKNELITKILSTKLFVGIGLISYSLYLWHYPIFAFSRITGFIGA